MSDVDDVIAATFKAAAEDEKCSPSVEALRELYASQEWGGAAILKVISEQGRSDEAE